MSTFERALAIAAEAHAGDTDHLGNPAVLHPLRVMMRLDAPAARIVAVLHDVVEDSTWTVDDLRAEGFAEPVVAAVDALSRREGEDYFDFVRRAIADPIGRGVKVADLSDNLSQQLQLPDAERDDERVQRYERALALIAGAD